MAREISWREALDEAGTRLAEIRERHGADSTAFYLGNPTGNDGPTILYIGAFLKALGSRRRYTASSVDHFPKLLANACLYGGNQGIPVPDVDRTSYFLILGANPAGPGFHRAFRRSLGLTPGDYSRLLESGGEPKHVP